MALPYVTENKVEKIINQTNRLFFIDLKNTLVDTDNLNIDITELVDIDEFKNAISSGKVIVCRNTDFLGDFNMKFIMFNESWTSEHSEQVDEETVDFKCYFTGAFLPAINEQSYTVGLLITATICYIDEEAIVLDDYKDVAGKVMLHVRFMGD